MKNIRILLIVILCYLIQIACSTSKNNSINQGEITSEERCIINTFLRQELDKDLYRLQKDSIILIEEAISKKQVVEDYDSMMAGTKHSLLDSLQKTRIADEIANERQYLWRETDFTNFTILVRSKETMRIFINDASYLDEPGKYIFQLSLPIMLDENHAILSFFSGRSEIGISSLTSGVVLMVKNKKGKWEITQHLGSRYS